MIFFFRHVAAEVVQYLIFIPILSSASIGTHELQLSGNYNSAKASGTEATQPWHLNLEKFPIEVLFFYFMDDIRKIFMNDSKKTLPSNLPHAKVDWSHNLLNSSLLSPKIMQQSLLV